MIMLKRILLVNTVPFLLGFLNTSEKSLCLISVCSIEKQSKCVRPSELRSMTGRKGI